MKNEITYKDYAAVVETSTGYRLILTNEANLEMADATIAVGNAAFIPEYGELEDDLESAESDLNSELGAADGEIDDLESITEFYISKHNDIVSEINSLIAGYQIEQAEALIKRATENKKLSEINVIRDINGNNVMVKSSPKVSR